MISFTLLCILEGDINSDLNLNVLYEVIKTIWSSSILTSTFSAVSIDYVWPSLNNYIIINNKLVKLTTA